MAERPRVLFVDDEPHVLEGLTDTLRREFRVETTTSQTAALDLLVAETFPVIVSDMRMPGMDGADLLAEARRLRPDTTRILLTGQSDMASAVRVVNKGQIFRFLTKPTDHETLVGVLTSAVEQNRLVTSEKVLLEETLRGAVDALTEVLSLADPAAFGRAGRVRRYVVELGNAVRHRDLWRAELAAMLMHVGYVALPPDLAQRLGDGEELTHDELEFLDGLPAVAERLLSRIPRLDDVRDVLRQFALPFAGDRAYLQSLESRLLRIASDYELLEAQGIAPSLALATMRGRAQRYDPSLLDTFGRLRGEELDRVVRELPLDEIELGMVFVDDVKTTSNGTMLVARGHPVTPSLLERLRSFPAGVVREPLRMVVSSEDRSAEAA